MPSFDIVSQVDMQEVRNAVDQSMRAVVNRYDFKGTDTKISLTDDGIVWAENQQRVEAAIDAPDQARQAQGLAEVDLRRRDQARRWWTIAADFTLNQGINQDDARKLVKIIRDMKLKVQAQIQGDQLRVQGKKRHEFQEVIVEVKALDFACPCSSSTTRLRLR